MPERIQLKRTKGWRMPPHTKKVDRSTPWGNPYVVSQWLVDHCGGDEVKAAQLVVERFQAYLAAPEQVGLVARAREALAGYNLACWCRLERPCHGDVWLAVLNEETMDD